MSAVQRVPVTGSAPARGVEPGTAAPADAGSRGEIAAGSIAEAVEALNRYAAQAGAELSFRVDDELGRIIVTVLDKRDGSVLRQIPAEEALRISRMIQQARASLVEGVV
ncbi:MAG: flagellar protein FlaG [Gammaproteobacteria bacterium]